MFLLRHSMNFRDALRLNIPATDDEEQMFTRYFCSLFISISVVSLLSLSPVDDCISFNSHFIYLTTSCATTSPFRFIQSSRFDSLRLILPPHTALIISYSSLFDFNTASTAFRPYQLHRGWKRQTAVVRENRIEVKQNGERERINKVEKEEETRRKWWIKISEKTKKSSDIERWRNWATDTRKKETVYPHTGD